MKPLSFIPRPCSVQRQQGVLAVSVLLLIGPLLLLWAGVLVMARHHMLDTRVHQAQIQASLALAQSKQFLTAAQRQQMLTSYMRFGTASLGSQNISASNSSVSFDKRVEKITSRFSWLPLFDHDSHPFFASLDGFLTSTSTVMAERFKRRTEIVFALDASLSLGERDIERIREGVASYVAKLFDDEDDVDDVWVSLIGYSARVNIGWKYRDKLITPASRKIPTELRPLAQQYGWLEGDDLLHPNGVEGWRKGACVARPPIIPGETFYFGAATMQKYLDVLFAPPRSPEDGFDLVIATDAEVTDEAAAARVAMGNTSNTAFHRLLPGMFRALGISPPAEERYQQPPVTGNKDPKISSDLDCSNMPILIASRNKTEILERLKLYVPVYNTGGDEGLAWAWRALNPSWNSLWNAGAAPHDYFGNVEKKLIWITDGANDIGYVLGNKAKVLNIVPYLCLGMRRKDIQMSVIAFGPISQNSRALADIRSDCVSDRDRNYFVSEDSSKLTQNLLTLSAQAAQVRLLPRFP